MKFLKSSLAAGTLLLALSNAAFADPLLFNFGPTDSVAYRLAGSGVGQGVSVGTNATITSFAFLADSPFGGDFDFLIADASQNVLFSQQEAVSASRTQTWVSSGPLSFTLSAGSTYYFGLISDNDLEVDYFVSGAPYSNNGLTAVLDSNANFTGYLAPAPSFAGLANIGLQLYGTSGGTSPVAPTAPATPEPNSLLLLGTGMLSVAGTVRRRLKR